MHYISLLNKPGNLGNPPPPLVGISGGNWFGRRVKFLYTLYLSFFTFVFLRLATRDFSYLWGQQQVFVVLSGRERDTQNYIYI